MRTVEQINNIKKTFSRPYTINCLDSEELKHLINIYDSADNKNNPKVYKNTGPVTLNISPYLDDPIIEKILKTIENQIGTFEITAGFFFNTHIPHIIHNDDTYELPDTVYKGITIPLRLNGNVDNIYPKLCFFDQYYFHGPAKFFKGEPHMESYFNKPLYSYEQVENLVDDKMVYDEKLFGHLRPRWLEGLSLAECIDWIPGSIIIFDSLQLHCASDFRKLGFTSKTAISIFTKKI